MKMTIKNLLAKMPLSPSLWRGVGAALLLLWGSAGLMAQTDDFGEVQDGRFQNSMNITGYVRMVTLVGGQWVPVSDEVLGNETVVAVFCGDDLRGKDSPSDYSENYHSLLRMTVYGENNDKLHFKVLTNGHVIESAPDNLVFVADGLLGKAKDPYYIDLPVPVNTNFSTEGWATTCLPFDAEVPDDVTLWNATAIENGELVLEEIDADVLPKDTPVLLQAATPGSSVSHEWLARAVDEATLEANVSLFDASPSLLNGTTEPKAVTPNSVLTLGHSIETGDLGFWIYTAQEVPANRAYITDFPFRTNGARIAIGDEGTTGIVNNERKTITNNRLVYDLQGRLVNGSAACGSYKNGIAITNGRKVLKR